MAMSVALDFAINIIADGVLTSITIPFVNSPFFGFIAGVPVQLNPISNFNLPVGVTNLGAPGTSLTLSASISGKNITFTFSTTPPAGEVEIAGTFIF